MTFLPIVDRELRLASRRRSTYRLRAGAALIAGAITVTLALGRHQSPAQVGSHIFSLLSGLALAFALFAGVRCTADSLSEERREGTLGLLFLTDLRGYDIVLGKLVVTSLDAAYSLVAILPVLAVPLLLGAVTGSEFFRMNLLLLNAIVLSLVCGLVVSTFGRHERAVLLTTLLALLGITLGLPAAWSVATKVMAFAAQLDLRLISPAATWLLNSDLAHYLLLPSPAYAFRMVTDKAIRTAGHEYWSSMFTIMGLWSSGIALSSFFLPRVFQEKGRWQEKANSNGQPAWRYGDPASRRQLAIQLLKRNPFHWLLSRDRLPRIWSWTLSISLLLFAVIAPALLQSRQTEAVVVFGSFAAHALLKLMVATDAARRLNEDKGAGALELLLSTPLPVSTILQSQAAHTRALFTAPAVCLVVLNLIILAAGNNLRRELGPNYFLGAIVLLFDLRALTWLGMLNGLKERRYVRAVVRTFGTVMVVPWMICFFALFCFQPRNNDTVHAFFVWWFCGAALFDAILAHSAKAILNQHFRKLASNDEPPAPAAPPPVTKGMAPLLKRH